MIAFNPAPKSPRIKWSHSVIRPSPFPATHIHPDLVAIREAVILSAQLIDSSFTLEDMIGDGRRAVDVASRMAYAFAARMLTTFGWSEIGAALAKTHSSLLTSYHLMKTGKGRHTGTAKTIIENLGSVRSLSLHPDLSGSVAMQRRLLESVGNQALRTAGERSGE